MATTEVVDEKRNNASVPAQGVLRRFLQNASWNFVGTVLSQCSVFATNVLIANELGPRSFGEFSLLQNTALTLSAIAQVAMGVTATKYIAEFRDVDKVRAGRVLGLCSALTLVTGSMAAAALVVSASWLTTYVMAAPQLAAGLSISAVFVLFSAMNAYQIGALAGLESYKSISIYSALLGIAHFAFCGIGVIIWGLQGALIGMVSSALLRWIIYGVVLRRAISSRGITVQRKDALQVGNILREFALPAALSGLSAMPAIWIGNTLLVRQPEGYAEMGLYSAANTLRMLVLFFPLMLNNVGLSLLNSRRGNDDLPGYKQIFWANFYSTLVAVILGALITVALSTPLLSLFGKHFSMGHSILFILILSTVPEAMAIALAQILQSQEKMWNSLLMVAIPRDVLMVWLAYELVPLYGGNGLAWSYAISWFCAFITVVVIVRMVGLKVRS